MKLTARLGLAFLLALTVVAAVPSGTSGAVTPTFRQAKANEIGSGTVNNVAFNSANTAGNLIAVQVLWSNAGNVTVTDTRGNAYLAATTRATWSGTWSAQTFYAKNVLSGTNTVRATFATSITAFAIVQAHEYSGIDKVNPLDGATAAAGSGKTMNSGPIATTNANNLLFAGGGSLAAMNAFGSPWSARLNTSGNRTADRNVTTTGSYSAIANHSGGAWVMQLAAFKADAGADTTPPSTPANLTATATSPSQINLGWNASTDDTGVTGYQVERCQGSGCTSFTLVTTVTGTSFADTGLSAATTYRYRVRATDAAGNLSGYSSIASATTQTSPDTIPPSVPTGLTGDGVSISQINLSWTAATDNVGVTGYRVFRDGAPVGTTAATSFQDTGLTVGTTYGYTVSAFDAAGNNSAQSPSVNVRTRDDTTAPSVPTNLAAQVVSSTQINLSWTPSTDDVGVALYKVYRDGAFLKSTTVIPVQDTGLTPGTTYGYRVSAVDAAGNESAQTAPVPATTPAPDTTPPSASMTAPAPGSTVSGTITVTAAATDNVAVADVEFLLDGVSIGVDATAPYSVSWNTTTTTNGTHNLSARARDTSGNFGVTSGVVTVTVNNGTAPSLPPGLVAGWNFNDSTGPTSADVTGNGNTVTLVNNLLWTAGKYASGIKLNGTNQFLSIVNSPTINLSGTAMAFSTWINPVSTPGDHVLFGKFYNGTMTSPFYQYGMELRGSGLVPTLLIGTGSGLKEALMAGGLPPGQWSHLAVVFNGSQAQFYVNGNLVNSAAIAASLTARDTSLYLGADVSSNQFLNGTLDDVRLYNRTLTQAEIQSDLNTPLLAPATDPTAPTVRITAPVNGAQVSGSTVITADAADDVGVAGVQFFIDGSPIGPEDTAAPYGATWDTRTSTNGAHTLTARARDTSGHVTVATPINVNVVNSDHFQNEILATGLDLPTAMKFLPDGRMLVAELQGRIKVIPPPYTTPDPNLFLQIPVGSAGVQQGIFDLALDPDFATNHYYYLFYTSNGTNNDRLSRFTANAALSGTIAGSELILYQDPETAFIEHHGGGITFANDGKILLTTGEHFHAPNAQDLSSPRGKILRLNKDGTVPTDNPFYDGNGPNWDAIWAYGLRNPYRAYFDAPTNRLFIGDVGGNDHPTSNEELNIGARGADYGWPDFEGQCQNPCVGPLYDYEHNSRDAAITGGFVYHGSQFPASMRGNYFFGDYAQNWIKRITFDTNGNVTGVFNFEPADGSVDGPTGDIVYLTEGPDGSLFYIDLGYSDVTGSFGVSKIRRIRYLQSNQAPIAVAAANPTSGPVPLAVAFSSAGSTDPEGQPLSYSWDLGDGTVSTAANPNHTYAIAGSYTVRLTVSDGVSSTFSTPLTITAGSAPTATITGPADGTTFRAGDLIAFSGDATDPEDGVLPASAFSWTVDFLHDGHVHPGPTSAGVKSGSFGIPTSGHDFSGNTRYRITLTVTDSNGLKDVRTVTVWPEKVDLSFDTVPSGRTLHLDGIARTTPFVYDTLIGFSHTVEARDQTSGGTAYSFASWSDGGARTHTLVVPATKASYTATFTATPINSGPAAAWGFNENGGGTAADTTGHGNTATLVNGPTWTVGRHGSALSFDGVNDYLAVGNSPALDISGTALSLSMWINPATVSGDSVVMGKFYNPGMTSPYYQYGLELSGGRPAFYLGTTGGLLGAFMTSPLALNQWTHLGIVFTGTQVHFFINGALVQTTQLTATITARGQRLHVGADADPWQFYKGLLDDVRVYNRTLTATEIQADMNTGA